MISNRFIQKKQPSINRRRMRGGLLPIRKAIANFVKRASDDEEARSTPMFPNEQHALLKSKDGKRFVSHNFSGPQTQIEKRLARGDQPVDQLDRCSKTHDIAYAKLTNARKVGKIDRKEHVEGVKSADNEFRACASKVKDRPRLAKIASSAIGTKAFAENLGILPRSVFSGVQKEDGPAGKLKMAAAQSVSNGSNVVEPIIELEKEEKVGRGRKPKKVAGLNHQTGGFPPLLVGIAGSLLASLGAKAVESVIDHFTSGDKTGGGLRLKTKRDKIDFLLKNVHPQEIINLVEDM